MHYFSPVPKMPLVEIAVTDRTAPEVIATCVELARRQGKQVIVVNDGVGFYTTRILGAYMNEALRLLERGAPIEKIDTALRMFGFPMGPLQVADSVGIDVAAEIGQVLYYGLGDRFETPGTAAKLVEAGHLGIKTGRGFYRYRGSDRGDPDPKVYELLAVTPRAGAFTRETIAWRCVLRMLDEAVRCRADGVLRSERDGDAGAVFGLGFPPLLGGPFRMIENLGARAVADKLSQYELASSPALLEVAR